MDRTLEDEQLQNECARLIKQVEQLREALNNFMASECGDSKLCGHSFTCTCPFELAKLALIATAPEGSNP